jgi:hypothetical protein
MKPGFTCIALLLVSSCWLSAAPITYEEVSLLVRMHESDAYIAQQVAQRLLVRPLTPPQEASLKAQGASEAVLRSLRRPDTSLSEAEAAAYETARAEQKKAVLDAIAADAARENARLALALQEREREAAAVREREREAAAREKADYQADIGEAYFGYPFGLRSGCVSPFIGHGGLRFQGSSATLTYTNGEPTQTFGRPPFDPNCGVPGRVGDGGFHSHSGGVTHQGGNIVVHSGGARAQAVGSSQSRSGGGAGGQVSGTGARR